MSQSAGRVKDPDAELETTTRWKLRSFSLIFVVGMFVLMELMRYALVSNLGRHRERLLAEGVTSLIFGLVLLKWLQSIYERRQQAIAQMRRVLEANDRIRNALEMISLSAYVTQNQEAIRVISEGVNRIQFVLRDVLPAGVYLDPGTWGHRRASDRARTNEPARKAGNGD